MGRTLKAGKDLRSDGARRCNSRIDFRVGCRYALQASNSALTLICSGGVYSGYITVMLVNQYNETVQTRIFTRTP
jgi:hypothetical protein